MKFELHWAALEELQKRKLNKASKRTMKRKSYHHHNHLMTNKEGSLTNYQDFQVD